MTNAQVKALVNALERGFLFIAAGTFAIAGSGWSVIAALLLIVLFVAGKSEADATQQEAPKP